MLKRIRWFLRTLVNWLVYIEKLGLWNSIILIYFKNRNRVFTLKLFKEKFHIRGRSTDFIVFFSIFFKNEYAIHLPEGFVCENIIDAGANTGFFSLYFAKMFPKAKIFSIEPEDSNFELLRINTSRETRIIPVKGGLWYRDADLQISNASAEKYAFRVDEASDNNSDYCFKGYSINSIMAMNNIGSTDILKIDIEGAEKILFEKGDLGWLDKTKIIIIEIHDLLEKGAGMSVFKALNGREYQLMISGENLVIYLQNE